MVVCPGPPGGWAAAPCGSGLCHVGQRWPCSLPGPWWAARPIQEALPLPGPQARGRGESHLPQGAQGETPPPPASLGASSGSLASPSQPGCARGMRERGRVAVGLPRAYSGKVRRTQGWHGPVWSPGRWRVGRRAGSAGWARAARRGLFFSPRHGDPVAQGRERGDLSLCLPRQPGTPLNARRLGRPSGQPSAGAARGPSIRVSRFGGPRGPGSRLWPCRAAAPFRVPSPQAWAPHGKAQRRGQRGQCPRAAGSRARCARCCPAVDAGSAQVRGAETGARPTLSGGDGVNGVDMWPRLGTGESIRPARSC